MTLMEEIMGKEELKKALLELQRKAEAEGWPEEEYAGMMCKLINEAGIKVTPEQVTSALRQGDDEDLEMDDLDNVSGGACGDCVKGKPCANNPEGRSCVPNC